MSDKLTNELLPCPFCGGPPYVHTMPRKKITQIRCSACGFGRGGAEKWNTRAQARANAQGEAVAIHYPDCWDTAAYPTVADALAEVYGSFKCSNDDNQHPDSLPDDDTCPHVMSKFATQLDCLQARDKWHRERISELRAHMGRK